MNLRLVLSCGASLFLASAIHAQATLLDLVGALSDRFGHACDVVGDTNGDGFGEILVSAVDAPDGSSFQVGRLTLHSGADGSVLVTVLGSGNFDRLGVAASAVGDVNGDGQPDFCATSIGTTDPGTALVLSGIDGSVLLTLTGSVSLGWSVAGPGDVNGDGRDDVLVGAPLAGSDAEGMITVFSGADGAVLHTVLGEVGPAPHQGESFGTGVGRVGDVDGDGKADFAGLQQNAARIFSGADGSEIWRRTLSRRGSNQISGGIDANGDGFDDFVIGSFAAPTDAGRVQLVSGRDNTILFEILGGAPGDHLGGSVAAVGDLDGDGYGDFAAGMPGFDGAAGTDTGAVRAYSGRTGGVIATVEGDLAADELGWNLGGGRDVNGDGIPDVVAGLVRSGKAKAISFVPLGLEPFGTGTAGCRGSSTLLANGVPTLGNAGFALHASGTGAAPLLLIGDTEDTVGSLHFGARFHLDFVPPAPAVGLVFQTRLPEPDANGSLVAPFPIPLTPALAGIPFVFQVVSVFPSGTCAQRLTTSRGLRVTIQ